MRQQAVAANEVPIVDWKRCRVASLYEFSFWSGVIGLKPTQDWSLVNPAPSVVNFADTRISRYQTLLKGLVESQTSPMVQKVLRIWKIQQLLTH